MFWLEIKPLGTSNFNTTNYENKHFSICIGNLIGDADFPVALRHSK